MTTPQQVIFSPSLIHAQANRHQTDFFNVYASEKCLLSLTLNRCASCVKYTRQPYHPLTTTLHLTQTQAGIHLSLPPAEQIKVLDRLFSSAKPLVDELRRRVDEVRRLFDGLDPRGG
jgi:hypothetical protein